jgi:hypothetical protein
VRADPPSRAELDTIDQVLTCYATVAADEAVNGVGQLETNGLGEWRARRDSNSE